MDSAIPRPATPPTSWATIALRLEKIERRREGNGADSLSEALRQIIDAIPAT